MAMPVTMTVKRAMLNHGVDLMGGSGGFTSGVHTDEDINLMVAAFEASLREMKAEGVL
jgi:glutamate-1-semialdehyde aminotransferase